MNVNNNCNIIGRLTKDPVLRVTQNGNSQLTFTLAVQRTFKTPDGRYESDFINCLVWGKAADTIEKFFHKGSRIVVNGEWRTGNYRDHNGNTVYTNQLLVSDFGFIDKKGERPEDGDTAESSAPESVPSSAPSTPKAQKASTPANDFVSIPDGIDEELPFV